SGKGREHLPCARSDQQDTGDDQHQCRQIPPIRRPLPPESAAEHFGLMLQDTASVADLVTVDRPMGIYLTHIKVNLLRPDDSMAPRTLGLSDVRARGSSISLSGVSLAGFCRGSGG